MISVKEDHLSISKPEDFSSIVVSASIQFIKEQNSSNKLEDIGYKQLEDQGQFDDELFVLKLIVL